MQRGNPILRTLTTQQYLLSLTLLGPLHSTPLSRRKNLTLLDLLRQFSYDTFRLRHAVQANMIPAILLTQVILATLMSLTVRPRLPRRMTLLIV